MRPEESVLQRLARSAIDAVIPPRCPLCEQRLGSGRALAAADDRACLSCLERLSAETGLELGLEGLDGVSALGTFEGVIRALVVGLKFKARPGLAALAAELMVERTTMSALEGHTVVAVPRAPFRSSLRGYDPAQLIAGALGSMMRIETRECLVRLPGPRQTGRDREERLARGPRVLVAGPVPSRVLLVDDVMTTGTTLSTCARLLRAQGCRSVLGQTIAVTPRRSERRESDAALAPGMPVPEILRKN